VPPHLAHTPFKFLLFLLAYIDSTRGFHCDDSIDVNQLYSLQSFYSSVYKNRKAFIFISLILGIF
jgi:hypothetical protein